MLLVVLIHAAVHPSRVGATAATASRRTKFVFAVTPGPPGSGRDGPGAVTPRTVRIAQSRPLDTVAPRTISRVDPPPVAPVPSIATQDLETALGAFVAMGATAAGPGPGTSGGGSRGTGIGPGEGPEVGEVYESGVGGVSDPRLVREVKPNYTSDAMRAKIQGIVTMEVVVLADGRVDPARIRITHSLGWGLDEQAVLAVRQWRFSPSLRLGQPVASRVLVELAFTLR